MASKKAEGKKLKQVLAAFMKVKPMPRRAKKTAASKPKGA